MKKFLFLSAVAFLSAFSQFTLAQDFGLSFSYFVPKNGYFSAPISPFSIRGLGVDFNRNFAFETGTTLYRISGLSLKNLPFEYDGPLTGPNFTVFVPAELVLMLQAGIWKLILRQVVLYFMHSTSISSTATSIKPSANGKAGP